jgi:hypothetical protein
MAALKFRKKLLLAKVETTYGTDATPTGAANAIQTSNLTITPIQAETAQQNLDSPFLGNEIQYLYGVHVMMEFDVSVAGSGTAGTAPNYGPLLLGCGTAETVTALQDTVYTPVSASEDSLTLYVFIDGQKHAMTGARGTFSLRFENGFPLYHFQYTGLWVDPASVANPDPTWTGWSQPVVLSNSNTTFSLHSGTPNMLSFTFDQANSVVYRNVVGEESVQIVDRAPAGNATIEAPALGTKNWFTTIKANTTGALQIVHGTTAGNIVQFDAAKVQMTNPRYGDDNGIATLQMDAVFIPTSGDDDFKITVK